ncbi:MAG: transposase, partial [Clostridia bacterium]|nr:transposase [Clostridia bacterium]
SLPPYSPDLNPIEQVWRITRREKTHNRYWKNLDSLVATLDA